MSGEFAKDAGKTCPIDGKPIIWDNWSEATAMSKNPRFQHLAHCGAGHHFVYRCLTGTTHEWAMEQRVGALSVFEYSIPLNR